MKEIHLSFEIRIQVEPTDVNWLETLLTERAQSFQEGLLSAAAKG